MADGMLLAWGARYVTYTRLSAGGSELNHPTPPHELVQRAEHIARDVVRPNAGREDREALWPEPAMRALADAELMGLNAPRNVGGHGLGLEALVNICRVLARENPSASLCFGMHCVGTATLAAKATDGQRRDFLEPIAAGEHITTLALSEPGTGADFHIPETSLDEDGDAYVLDGVKSFVTNGSHADSYVMSTVAAERGAEEGAFSAVVVEAGTPGMEWQAPWQGFGMRGNSSRTVRLEGVRIGKEHLLGEKGDQLWYMFEVIVPYFLAAMAGTYLGIAEAAVEIAGEHLGSRRRSHTGELLGSNPTLAAELGNMWIRLESSRQLVLSAVRRADAAAPDALVGVLACKAAASSTSVELATEAMALMGGNGYREDSHLSRLLRDAHASHVMAPTTQVLNKWVGRAIMGMPLLR
jgi:isovaleryl-CoA dehydrogenase